MKQEDLDVLQDKLCKDLLNKAENDIEFHRGELLVKRLNAVANLKKQNNDSIRLQLEQQRLQLQSQLEQQRLSFEQERLKLEQQRQYMDERRLCLDEIQAKYNITSDMVRKSEKIQRAIGKTMLGLFPEQDKQVVKIMEAAKKLTDLQS